MPKGFRRCLAFPEKSTLFINFASPNEYSALWFSKVNKLMTDENEMFYYNNSVSNIFSLFYDNIF